MAARRTFTTAVASLALAVAGLVGLIGTVATSAPAGALPPPPAADSVLWTQVQALGSDVPGDDWIADVACPEAGECIAVGAAGDPAVPVYATSSGGVWSPMHPIDVSGLPGYTPNGSQLGSVSCFAALDCTAVGNYSTGSTTSRPFGISVDGTIEPPFAIDFTDIGAFTSADLVKVSCGAPADCGMVGSVLVSGVWHAITVNRATGGVENARLVTVDGTVHDAVGSRGRGISCAAAGVCTAVGTSSDVFGIYGFAASRTGGSWIPASAVLAPPGAGSNPNVFIEWESGAHPIECTADRVCSLVATYSPHDRRNQVFVASSNGGAFGTGEAVRFPTPYNFESDAVSISCPTGGNCVAVGFLFQSGGCSTFPDCTITPFAVTSRSGTWAPADLLNFSDDISARHLGTGFAVDCAVTVDDCALVGTFANRAGGFEALGATRTHGTWSQGRRIAGPTQPGSYNDVELWSIECATPQRCTAGGGAWLGPGGETGVVVDTWPMPAGPANVRASVVPGRRVVSVAWDPPPPAVLSPCAPSSPHTPCTPLNPVPTDYQVRCDTVGGDTAFVGATASPAFVTVPAVSTQRCAVRARYGTPVGASFLGDWFEGPLSGAAPVNVPAVAPDTPTGVRASTPPQPSGRSTLLTFALPTNVSGAPVTAVEASCTSSNGGVTRSVVDPTASSPVGIVDLTAGRTYSCKVRSRNSVGPSAWAYSPTIVVPAGPATNVRASTPTARQRATTVTFTRPDGGPPPSTYRVTCTSSDGGQARTLVKSGSPYVVEGLTAGRTYRCTVTALFDGTPGPVSAASNSITV
ncbi:MAG: fibronectin type III domain-containing protein, partial [Actinomycetes bacterium]